MSELDIEYSNKLDEINKILFDNGTIVRVRRCSAGIITRAQVDDLERIRLKLAAEFRNA